MSQFYYQIRIQQGDVAFEIEATTPEFASEQLQKLAREVLGITPAVMPAPVVMPQPVAVPINPVAPAFEVSESVPPQLEIAVAVPETVDLTPVVAEPEAPVEADPQFEAFMDTLLSDLDNPESEIKLPFENAPAVASGAAASPVESPVPEAPTGLSALNLGALKDKKIESFDSVFNEAQLQLNVAEAQPVVDSGALFQTKGHNVTSIETLQELCEMAANAKTAEDFLLLTGYFLHQYKETPTYSLKILNTELVRTGLTPINHSILESTVKLGMLAMVPDLTGEAQTTEYELTPDGSEYVKQLIGLV